MANTYSAGIVTAYGAAKKAGYTGTYEEFCAEQAGFAQNAQQVRQDKESVEQTVNTFSSTTVPAAVQSVTDEGTRQIELVGDAGTTQIGHVQAEGSTQIGNVNNAGTVQVGNVNSAGTTQVGNVTSEGTTQVGRVQAKGDEVLASIPSDYSELSYEVDNLTRQINHFDDNLPGTVQTVNFGTDGKPSSVVHTKNGTTVRTDAYTWGDGTVTETRTTADGSYITMVTDLSTLITTISEIQEAS